MSLKKTMLWIIGLLIVVDGITGGAVMGGVSDLAFSDDKEAMRNTLICIVGLKMYAPVRDYSYPMPSILDIVLSAGLVYGILLVLKKYEVAYNWKHGIGLFASVWVLLRVFLISSPVVVLRTPIPSGSNLAIAAVITSAIIAILHFANVKYNWKHGIGIFILIWMLYRLAGWVFIQSSGATCEVLLTDTASKLSGIWLLGSLSCLPVVWKVLIKAKG